MAGLALTSSGRAWAHPMLGKRCNSLVSARFPQHWACWRPAAVKHSQWSGNDSLVHPRFQLTSSTCIGQGCLFVVRHIVAAAQAAAGWLNAPC